MATPLIVRLLPAGAAVGVPPRGPSAGRTLVELYGGNFRLPPSPPTSGPTSTPTASLVRTAVPKTVSVKFGGVEALDVRVARGNLLVVLVPTSPIAGTAPNHGEGFVDVVVTNLDDNGVAIAGETATLANGWEYWRPRLDAYTESDLLRLVKAFVNEWKRQVIPEVVLTQSVDWDPDTSTPVVEIASMPALALVGPATEENRFYSVNDNPEDPDGLPDGVEGLTTTRNRPFTIDLTFDVIGIAEGSGELINLMNASIAFVDRNTDFFFDRDPSDAAKGKVSYEFAFTSGGLFKIPKFPNTSNVHYFTGQVVVVGVDVEAFAGFVRDDVADRSATLETLALDVEPTGG